MAKGSGNRRVTCQAHPPESRNLCLLPGEGIGPMIAVSLGMHTIDKTHSTLSNNAQKATARAGWSARTASLVAAVALLLGSVTLSACNKDKGAKPAAEAESGHKGSTIQVSSGRAMAPAKSNQTTATAKGPDSDRAPVTRQQFVNKSSGKSNKKRAVASGKIGLRGKTTARFARR